MSTPTNVSVFWRARLPLVAMSSPECSLLIPSVQHLTYDGALLLQHPRMLNAKLVTTIAVVYEGRR